MNSISRILRYPIKSMGGHDLSQTHIGELGIPGDRCWTLKDEARGGIKGGKRFPAIMGMQAELTAEPSATMPSPRTKITLADGSVLHTDDTDINQRLTSAVGAEVAIWPLLPADQLEHYKRLPPDPDTDQMAALREVFARTDDEPLPDLSVFPPELMTYESPPGTYFDAYPLLIMSEAALQSMQAGAADSVIDIRRFRPNILLNTQDDGYPEDAWAGKTIRLGSAVLKLELACPRCIMTTHGFADLPKDPQVMRALVRENNGNLGIYANVVTPGEIKLGDSLEFL